MKNNEIANFFKQMSHELNEMNDSDVPYNEYDNIFSDWKQNLIPKIEGTYKIKIKRIDTLTYDKYPELLTILRDMYVKYEIKDKKTKDNLEIKKLLKAREENIDFELELAKMITGDNTNFPCRSSSELTDFFQNLGHNYIYSADTQQHIWVKDRLTELHIKDIHVLLTQGLFRKKYFVQYVEELNNETHEEFHGQCPPEYLINVDECINKAEKDFKQFVKDSITANNVFDLSTVLDMNINVGLLFDNKADTEDKELNKLIEDAKDRFLNKDDKQIALEKLWGAFERLKTYFSKLEKNGKDKKQSAIKVVDIISNHFDKDFLLDEFDRLSKIGNNYRIRHHEKNRLELTDNHRNYFFFRLLSLIDLCLVYLNEENEE